MITSESPHWHTMEKSSREQQTRKRYYWMSMSQPSPSRTSLSFHGWDCLPQIYYHCISRQQKFSSYSNSWSPTTTLPVQIAYPTEYWEESTRRSCTPHSQLCSTSPPGRASRAWYLQARCSHTIDWYIETSLSSSEVMALPRKRTSWPFKKYMATLRDCAEKLCVRAHIEEISAVNSS